MCELMNQDVMYIQTRMCVCVCFFRARLLLLASVMICNAALHQDMEIYMHGRHIYHAYTDGQNRIGISYWIALRVPKATHTNPPHRRRRPRQSLQPLSMFSCCLLLLVKSPHPQHSHTHTTPPPHPNHTHRHTIIKPP